MSDKAIEALALIIGNEAREYAGLEPYTETDGIGWDSCRRLAKHLLARFPALRNEFPA